MPMVIVNIGLLAGVMEEPRLLRGEAMKAMTFLENAYLIVEGETIAAYGNMDQLKYKNERTRLDATGRIILPCWCDSHTHLVFAGSREAEFADRIRGLSYQEIAARGGGILHSAKELNETSEETLFQSAWQRLLQIRSLGTGAVEIKSGYGLSPEGELKSLRVIRRLKESSDLIIKSTFLGAHAYPEEFRNDHQGYIHQIINEMLPVIAEERLADFIDVFCEDGFFSVQEAEQVLQAGKQYGLKPKVHANQLSRSGGVQMGVDLGAISVDHLESIGEEEISSLANAGTVATLLPTAAFFLGMPYAPVRKLLEKNVAVALATDFNPGSSPSGNMPLMIAIACSQMKMTPEEAINAATINGACAMEIQDVAGSITVGKRANLIMTRPIPSLAYLPYSFGENLTERIIINGCPDDQKVV